MSATVQARGVSFAHGPKDVLRNVDLVVAPGMRVGVLGPNGVGKSTLLGVLSGRLQPDAGAVVHSPATATIGELRQETERLAGETVADFLARRTGVAAANRELDEATAALASGDDGADDRYSTALEQWLALGAADFEPRMAEVIAEIGLTDTLLDAPMSVLSGGQAARAGLAALLLSRFDILFLDEPTNDLDFAGLEQLERFALDFKGALVVVSHDRAFLDRVVTHVAEIDHYSHEITVFAGGWSAFLHEREVARQHAEDDYAEYEAKKSQLTARAQREREWSHVGVKSEKSGQRDNDKAARKFRANNTEQLASRARRTERAIERLDAVDEPREAWQLRFTIATAARAGAVVARLDGAVVRQGDFTLGPVTLEIGWGERIGIVGPNGGGKTTLLRTLLGRTELADGARWMGPSVVVGELDQARGQFSGEWSLLDAFMDASGLTIADARTLMAKFGLVSDHVHRSADSLSPGERTRAAMALLQARGSNLLVLDEPTNHLDMPAIEQLEEALATFPGTLLLVTHDRRLLESIPFTRTLRVEGTVVEQ
jgi:ATPase subunit of ABC transporter with duplicated ATPase domains